MLNLLRYELRARRGGIIGWGLGLALFGYYIVILYPQFAPQLANFDLENIEFYQMLGDFTDMASFAGFLSAEIFSWIPIMLGIYAIVSGTGTLAGEEDSGTLELLMALPLPRWQLVLVKTLALALALLLILLLLGLGLIGGFTTLDPQAVDLGGVTSADLLTAVLSLWPLIMLFAALALFLGAYLPNRRTAAWVAILLLIFTYFANNLAAISQPLELLQPLYPFHYFNTSTVLTEGPDTTNLLIISAAILLFLTLTFIAFQRRNITVGSWPWQRAKPA
jgi:ABC-2 type transport system permease protein